MVVATKNSSLIKERLKKRNNRLYDFNSLKKNAAFDSIKVHICVIKKHTNEKN